MSNNTKPKAKGHNSNSLLFILLTIAIDSMGIGIIIPIVPVLLKELGHLDLSHAAKVGGYLALAYAVTEFVFAPVMGGLSDRFGRRPVLLLSLTGLAVNYLFLALAPGIAWLFVGRILSGIGGASYSPAGAYIADISTDENRTRNFGFVGAAFGVGFIFGPAIGGFFATYGARVPFLVAAVLTFANVLFGYFFLPESLPSHLRRKFNLKRSNPLGAFMQATQYREFKLMPLYLVVFGLITLASHASESTFTYVVMEVFNWNTLQVGASLAVIGVAATIVQGGLMGVISKKFGNVGSIYIGLVCMLLGNLLYGIFLFRDWQAYAYLLPYTLGFIIMPALQSILSGKVSADAQGELMGLITAINSLMAIAGPILMTQVFSYYTTRRPGVPYLPGAPFIAGFCLTLVAALLFYYLRKRTVKVGQ